jgi:hypothetical protein
MCSCKLVQSLSKVMETNIGSKLSLIALRSAVVVTIHTPHWSCSTMGVAMIQRLGIRLSPYCYAYVPKVAPMRSIQRRCFEAFGYRQESNRPIIVADKEVCSDFVISLRVRLVIERMNIRLHKRTKSFYLKTDSSQSMASTRDPKMQASGKRLRKTFSVCLTALSACPSMPL